MDYEGSKALPHKNPSNGKIRSLGVCLGASTVSLVQLEKDRRPDTNTATPQNNNFKIVKHSVYPHEGDPKKTLLRAINGFDLSTFDRIVATGRRFRSFVNLTSIPEPEAVEYAYRFIKPPDVFCPAVVSAGGETFMVYVLNRFGQISNVLTGNKCASGTGEFFLQQLRRMDVSLEEATHFATKTEPYLVSGRCSVFCKSDCTHATNKGIPKSKVTAGLCRMMAKKILELLKKVDRKNVMLTGGTARNQMMVERLREEIPGLIVPDEAPYFEALGAALWGLEHETNTLAGISDLFGRETASFDTLPPLKNFSHMVEFKTIEKGKIRAGDTCILGLDVGSTTTKAILLRKSDDAMLATIYLRTSGDPVGASRQCYRAILNQIKKYVDPSEISIIGLGVCGSGRQIAGLHALTDGVINEIIAHAAAAVYFDPKVDTIFEIGGQDAKYTYITNGVASDYAMNEACSAGTGSFLEESAHETLGVAMEDIADIAIKGKKPPNFNDQCAAFITSDIKNAIHEGVAHENIVAGLVYSICMNYSNRVKGNRPVGEKVFMQGGVCYNKAIPLAMASLVGKPIIVPPEPGLMGAYGVALEVKNRIDAGILRKQHFDLDVLVNRQVRYGKSFICKGGKEKCDRRCDIAMIDIEGTRYPFGGACNRYYNLRHKIKYSVQELDLVRLRQQLVFETYGVQPTSDDFGDIRKNKIKKPRKIVAINKSFLVNTYYPLYSTFFAKLGFDVVVSDTYTQKGIEQKNAAFCYPAELTHGFFHTLIGMENPPDYIFLPHFKAVPSSNGHSSSQVCPFVQGETFYLQTTYRKRLDELKARGTKLLSPLLDMTDGLEAAQRAFLQTASQMGIRRKTALSAFEAAVKRQKACLAEMRRTGEDFLQQLETDPERTAVVIFGRSYNGFVEEAHMGIPHKLASRGIPVLPFDFFLINREPSKQHMYWGMGQRILQVARKVKKHPQLFGVYITNFSCGPDSFLLGYFRDIMGRKPSLTLELDSHTADAGLETRIEAFIDIISAYRQLAAKETKASNRRMFTPARTVMDNGIPNVVTSSGKILPMTHPRVKLLIPSMGKLATESLAAIFRSNGFNAVVHPPSDEAVLKLGRANTSCKECLPLILTTGTMLNYIFNEKKADDILAYFMLTGSGPCRFGQYQIFMKDLVKRLEIPDVAIFSFTSENAYAGMGNDFHLQAWCGVVVSDIMEDIRSMLLTNAADVESAIKIFNNEWELIINAYGEKEFLPLENQLVRTAEIIREIPLKRPPETVPVISLVGEIYVRRDGLSRQYLTERLAEKGFAVICSPIAEWVLYADYLVDKGLSDCDMSIREKLVFLLKKRYMSRYMKRIKSILASSGLVHSTPLNIRTVINNASPHLSINLPGEAILTVGSALTEIASHTCGVIAIGPFGCMPNRLAESLLSESMTREGKLATDRNNRRLRSLLTDIDDLPFLAVESDGSPFPQVITAKLESFCLRAERLHYKMLEMKNNGKFKHH
jgi:predicted CoA-substrate-specific enzyme activase